MEPLALPAAGLGRGRESGEGAGPGGGGAEERVPKGGAGEAVDGAVPHAHMRGDVMAHQRDVVGRQGDMMAHQRDVVGRQGDVMVQQAKLGGVGLVIAQVAVE